MTGENEKETLMNQYESISKDFTYIFQEWEEGKKVLKEMTEPTPKDPDSIGSRQSLVEDIELPKDENEPIENSSEKPLIDWTQTDEPLDVPAQVFEAEAEPEVITKVRIFMYFIYIISLVTFINIYKYIKINERRKNRHSKSQENARGMD